MSVVGFINALPLLRTGWLQTPMLKLKKYMRSGRSTVPHLRVAGYPTPWQELEANAPELPTKPASAGSDEGGGELDMEPCRRVKGNGPMRSCPMLCCLEEGHDEL